MPPTLPPRRILLIGKGGQVGRELERLLPALGEVTACGRGECDLARPDSVRSLLRSLAPHLIVNAAAYTAVDRAEQEPELAHAVNAAAPALLAEESARLRAALVHYSTDYVFDGAATRPYREEDPQNPLNVYGRTKAEGDRAILESGIPGLIFRTSWVYGNHGHNFLNTIRRLARERPELRIVDDQTGAPTWCRSIAQATVNVLSQTLSEQVPGDWSRLTGVSGVYHLTCAGSTTWFSFARKIVESMNLPDPPRLIPIPTSEYPTPAVRPKYSVLANTRLRDTFGIHLPDWEGALNFCLSD